MNIKCININNNYDKLKILETKIRLDLTLKNRRWYSSRTAKNVNLIISYPSVFNFNEELF